MTDQEKDCAIAVAMGWDEIAGSPVIGGLWFQGRDPMSGQIRYVPQFHESEDAKARLLRWLADRPEKLRERFMELLTIRINYRLYGMGAEWAALTASPADVATAAYDVILRAGEETSMDLGQ